MNLHSEQTEKTLLGTLILDPDQIDTIPDLQPSDFFLESHRTVFNTLNLMRQKDSAIDVVTLQQELEKTRRIDSIGGVSYLWRLTEFIPRKSKAKPYADILREKATLRSIVNLCESVAQRADTGEDSSELLNDLQMGALQQQSSEVKVYSISELVVPYLDELRRQREFQGEVLGITSGIRILDQMTTGWRGGELTYVGALPGRGKTSFLLQAMYAAATAGHNVGCISLEMRAGQLMNRLGVMHSKIQAHKFRDSRLMSISEYAAARQAGISLGDLGIKICDQSGLKPGQISSLARKMNRDGVEIMFVDFVQIIREDGSDRREAINRVSAALRDTCKALNIPFVVASQLARRDADPNRRPTMQDLRESGNLEQDCHNCLMMYRPKDKLTGEWTGEDEIIIEKQREGMTGPIPVRYDEKSLTYRERL